MVGSPILMPGEQKDNQQVIEIKKADHEDLCESHDEEGEEETFYIIMEKAACTLLDDLQSRRAKRQGYSRDESIEYWR